MKTTTAMLLALVSLAGCQGAKPEAPLAPRDDSPVGIHRRMMILDQHLFGAPPRCPTAGPPAGGPDLSGMRHAGVDGGIWFTPATTGNGGYATTLKALATMTCWLGRQGPGVRIALRAGDAPALHTAGILAFYLGLSDSDALDGDPAKLGEMARYGVRFARLVGTGTNRFADAQGAAARWGGLSPAGRVWVAVANRAGVVIDVGGLSPEAIDQVRALSTTPLLFSRSMLDDTALPADRLEAIALAGGVWVQFGAVGQSPTGAMLRRCLGSLYWEHCGVGGFASAAAAPGLTKAVLDGGYAEGNAARLWGFNVLRILRRAEVAADER